MKKWILLFIFPLWTYAADDCFLEGQYRLDLVPYSDPYWLTGTIGKEHVRLDVSRGFNPSLLRVDGWIKNDLVQLEIELTPPHMLLRGWIHNTYIDWPGFGTSFTGYQNCIPN